MSEPSIRQQIRRVLLITLGLNLLVAFSKIILGIVTGALAITADGFHSLTDGASNVIGLFANRIAEKPPDANHPYGHRRFETIAALSIGFLLLIAAWEIITGAVERLISGGAPTITPLAFMVMIVTLAINIFITTYERREGMRLKSEFLIANSAHTRADVFVTISVLVSMTLVASGLWWADPIAALVVVALIGRVAWQVLRQTGSVLVDTAPYSPETLINAIGEVPSVERIVRARSRGPADAVHLDIDVQVDPAMTADHTAAIAETIRANVERNLTGVSEIEVHFAPAPRAAPDYALTARAHADALGLATHGVRVAEDEAGVLLEMHVEVPGEPTLAEAHTQVSQLEAEVRASLPHIESIVTHIEPAQAAAGQDPPTNGGQIVERAQQLLGAQFPDVHWHDLRVTALSEGAALTLHAELPAEMTLEEAHQLAEKAELALRSEIPCVLRVTIHTEPAEL